MLQDLTAADLADVLENPDQHWRTRDELAELTEATAPFGRKTEQIHQAQRQFSRAQFEYSSAPPAESGDAWTSVVDAARRLATVLRPLGAVRIARCAAPTTWGTCKLPLDDHGQCPSPLGHLSTT
jgi:hypothetical protein